MQNIHLLGRQISLEFIKFAIVGVVNTIIHMTILYILTEYFGVYYILASLIGFLVAVTNSFILNTIWTFNKDIREKAGVRYSKFFITSIIAAGVNMGLLYLITEYFGIWYMLSQIIATGISLILNFIGNKYWTYK
jgi:putative flippase GtrA